MKKIIPSRKTAIIIGVLFIIATLFLFIGESFYGPILNANNFLEISYPNRNTVILGLLLEFFCVISIPLIAIFLYPILRKFNETLAMGYVVFRFFEATLFISEEIRKLSIIDLSKSFLESDINSDLFFTNTAKLIQSEIAWNFSMYVIIFALGAMMLYWVLYQSELIPRFISTWGLIAAILILFGNILAMFELDFISSNVIFEIIFAAPIAIQEMVLAGWLITKGFNNKKMHNML